MKTNEKYITYRESRDCYQIKITIRKDDNTKEIITKQAKTLEKAIEIRNKMCLIYDLDLALLESIYIDNHTNQEDAHVRDKILKWYEIKKSQIELQTQRRYNNIIAKVIIPILGDLKISEINKQLMQQFILTLHEKGYIQSKKKGMAVSSLHVCGTLLKQFFDSLDLPTNPMAGVKYPKSDKQKREYLTENEVKAVLNYIRMHNHDKYFLYQMFFLTGCRRGELLGLTWKYVDFVNCTIQIQQTLINNPNTYGWELKKTPKNQSSERIIYIGESNTTRLKFYYEYAKKHDKDFSDNSFVFVSHARKPYCPKKISEIFSKAVKACKIKKNVSLHSTRHTFATKLINSGVNIKTVQALGGWGKATTLLNVYAHSDNSVLFEAMQKVML